MNLLQIIVLALIQGAAELLPVSSSAHVIVAQKLMGLDPSAPEMTFLLVMLHTGTMFAVLAYFWKRWRALIAKDWKSFVRPLLIATILTGVLGIALKLVIEKAILPAFLPPGMENTKSEIEELFRVLPLIAGALFTVGLFIIAAGLASEKKKAKSNKLSDRSAAWIGLVQGLCLPFRGFSRSGATISTALFQGVPRALAEDFSFALAVILTPPVIAQELHRLLKASAVAGQERVHFGHLLAPGLTGMVFSFGAGLLALRLLSSWLEKGRWKLFGFYCLGASWLVLGLYLAGY